MYCTTSGYMIYLIHQYDIYQNERKIHYMGAILEYKCPCCSGPLQFDTDAQKMKCPYCDNEFDAETLKSNDDILKEESPI